MDDHLSDTTRWVDPAGLHREVQALRDELHQVEPRISQVVTELRQEWAYEKEARAHNDSNMMNVISTMKDALKQEAHERQSRTTEFDNFMEMTTQIMHETQVHFRHEMQLVQETQTNIKCWMEERQQGATQLSNAIKEVQKKLRAEAYERAQQAKAVEAMSKNFEQIRQEPLRTLSRSDADTDKDDQQEEDLYSPAPQGPQGRVAFTQSMQTSENTSPVLSPKTPRSSGKKNGPWDNPQPVVEKATSSASKSEDGRPPPIVTRGLNQGLNQAEASPVDSQRMSPGCAEGTRVNLLVALNSLKKSFDREVQERIMNSVKLERHLSNFQQLRDDLEKQGEQLRQTASQQHEAAVAHTNLNIEQVRSEFKKQCESTEELLKVINRLKECFDKEVSERMAQTAKLERHIGAVEDLRKDLLQGTDVQRLEVAEQAHEQIGETNRNLEEVKAECLKQRIITEELLKTINCLKVSLDKEQAESFEQHRHVLKSIEESAAVVAQVTAATVGAATVGAATVGSATASSPPAIVTTHASERLERMRRETARRLSEPDALGKDAPTPQALSEVQTAEQRPDQRYAALEMLYAQVPSGNSVSTHLSDISMDAFSALRAELAQSEKKVLEAVEKERGERTSSFSTLNSHVANFQYNLSTERHERSRLHSDLMELKAANIRQQRELKEEFDTVSAAVKAIPRHAVAEGSEAERIRMNEEQEKRFQRLEHQALQHAELITLSTGAAALTAFGGEEDKVSGFTSNMESSKNLITPELLEVMRAEVLRVFGERQPAIIADLASTMKTDVYEARSRPHYGSGSLDRLVREADLFKLEQSVQRLEAIVIGQNGELRKQVEFPAQEASGLKELKASPQQEHVTREEFDSVTRHIWEAIGPESITRAEFDSHAQRLWDAIVQLQSRQLEDIRQYARDAIAGTAAFREANMASPDMPFQAISRSGVGILPPTSMAPQPTHVPSTPSPMRAYQASPGTPYGSAMSSFPDRPPALGLQMSSGRMASLDGTSTGGASPTPSVAPSTGQGSPRPPTRLEWQTVQTVSQSARGSPMSGVRSRAAPAQCGGDSFLPMSDNLSPRTSPLQSPRRSPRPAYPLPNRTISMN